MKVFLLAGAFFLFSNTAFAQPYRTSFGLSTELQAGRGWGILAGPAVKHFFTRHSAGEAALLYSGAFYLNAFYQYHFKLGTSENLQAYLGAGPTIGIASNPLVIARGQAGVEYRIKEKPWTMGIDWRPYYIITNDDDGNIFTRNLFGLSFRYVLK